MVKAETADLAAHFERVSAADDGERVGPLERIFKDQRGAGSPKAREFVRAQTIARIGEGRRGKARDWPELQSVLSREGAGLRHLHGNLAAVGPVEAKPEFVHHGRFKDVRIAESEIPRV